MMDFFEKKNKQTLATYNFASEINSATDALVYPTKQNKKEFDCNKTGRAAFQYLFKTFDSISHENPLKN